MPPLAPLLSLTLPDADPGQSSSPGGADTLPQSGTLDGPELLAGETVRVADGQALVLAGPIDANVLTSFVIGQDATLGLESRLTTDVLTTIDFAGGGGTLVLAAGFRLDIGSQITGFATGDVIDYRAAITGLTAEWTPPVTLLGDTIAPGVTTICLSNAAGQPVGSLRLVGDYRGQLALQTDGTGGTRIICLCLLAGTRIRTPSGERPVEDLGPGDVVETPDGPRTVTWTGSRRFELAAHARPEAFRPIRVAAGAFGPDMPARDLWLSPDHAVFTDGVLIPIRHLVNGATIHPDPRQDRPHYLHVELAQHGVLYAEGLAVESYLDTGDRESFVGGGPYAPAPSADMIRATWEARGYAPLAVAGPTVDAVRARLAARAAARLDA